MGIDRLKQKQAQAFAREEERNRLKIQWNDLLCQFLDKGIKDIFHSITTSDKLNNLQLEIKFENNKPDYGEFKFAKLHVVGVPSFYISFSVILSASLESWKGEISISFSRESRISDDTYTYNGIMQTMGIPVAVYVCTPLGYLKGKGTRRGGSDWTEGESQFLWQNDASTHQIIDFVLNCLEGKFIKSDWFPKQNWFSNLLK